MAGGWLVLVAFLLVNACRSETVTLHLRNGASVTGEMISLDTTFITITNAVLGKIAIPVVEVQRLEKKKPGQAAGQTTAAPLPAPATNPPPATPAAQTVPTNQPPQAVLPAPAPKPAATAAAQPVRSNSWRVVWSDDFAGPAGTPVSSANWLYDLGTSYPGGAPNWGTSEVESITYLA